MNKVYKLIWSKTKHCYVVVSELAKNYAKSSCSFGFSRFLTTRILLSILSFGLFLPSLTYASYTNTSSGIFLVGYGADASSSSLNSVVLGAGSYAAETASYVFGDASIVMKSDAYAFGQHAVALESGSYAIGKDAVATEAGTISFGHASGDRNLVHNGSETFTDGTYSSDFYNRLVNVADGVAAHDVSTVGQTGSDLDFSNNTLYLKNKQGTVLDSVTLDLGVTYSAGDGLQLNNNVFSVKPGTNVTVNNTGINVLGTGTVSTGNAGLISGGTAYSELRPANANYIQQTNTTAQNLTALDSNLYTIADKVNNRCFGIKSTYYLSDLGEANIDEMQKLSAAGGVGLIEAYNAKYSNKGGIGAVGEQTIAIGHIAYAEGNHSITIGNNATSIISRKPDGTIVTGTTGGDNVYLKGIDQQGQRNSSEAGYYNSLGGYNVVIGDKTYSRASDSVAIGYNAYNSTGLRDDGTLTQETTYHVYGENSVAIGARASTMNSYATAVGAGAAARYKGTAIGDSTFAPEGSISIGYDASPRVLKTFPVGNDLSNSIITIGYESWAEIGRKHYTAYSPIAIGHKVVSEEALVIGANSKGNNGSIVIGENAVGKTRKNSAEPKGQVGDIVIGNNAYHWSDTDYDMGGNVLLGHNTYMSAASENSVAIGTNSEVDGDRVVSFGHPYRNTVEHPYDGELTRRLTNVTAGVKSTDAATVGQLTTISAGKNVFLDGGINANGSWRTEVNVKSTDIVSSTDTRLISSSAVHDSITRNSALVAGNGVVIQNNYSDPQYQTVADIIAPYSTGPKKYDALVNAVDRVHLKTGKTTAEITGISDTLWERLTDAIYDEDISGYLTQTRYDQLLATAIMVEPAEIQSKTLSLNVDSNGTIAKNNTAILTGGTVYDEVRPVDGKYVRTANSVAQNLRALDALMVGYDSASHDTLTMDGASGTKLTNLKQGTLSANSTDAVTGAQLFATNQNIAGFAADITRNKENIRDMNLSVSAALDSVSSSSLLVDTINTLKADASLNNLTEAGRQVIATAAANAVQEYMSSSQQSGNVVPPVAPMMMTSSLNNMLSITDAGNGSLHVGEGSSVNGTSSIAIGVGNQVNANNSGAFGDPSLINADASYVLGNDDTIHEGATGSFLVGNDSVSRAKAGLSLGSNNTLDTSAEDSVLLGNHAFASAKNSVALGSDSSVTEENTVSVGNDSLRRRITNLMDGRVSMESSDAVTGNQLYQTNTRVDSLADTIVTKADADASNIDVDKWQKKLGNGQITEGDTGLVTGGTVFDAFSKFNTVSSVASYDETSNQLRIGASSTYDNVDAVSVAKSDGSSRVITGVATDPLDSTSAANVGYVNAVNDMVIQSVNGALEKSNRKIEGVGASAAAMSALTPASFEGDERWSLAASVGNYRSETAGAVGSFYKPAENIMMNLRGSFGTDENMVAAGVAVSLSKGDVPGVTKRQLAQTVNTQAQRLDEATTVINTQAQRIQSMEEKMSMLEQELREMKSKLSEK